MVHDSSSRRDFLRRSAAGAAAGLSVPYIFTSTASGAKKSGDKNSQLTTAAIGVGGQGSWIALRLAMRTNMIACCDVDTRQAANFQKHLDKQLTKRGKKSPKLEVYEDYRKLLDRKDIDAVTIGTPDHWHTPIVLYALRAGKDVYCEKPLTLTIDEGKLLSKVVRETGRVLQVGTQQRSEFGQLFIKAVALARSGRLGEIRRCTASIGSTPATKRWSTSAAPESLNFDMWLGQAPKVDYIRQRTHGTFRWWYEYSGGKLTDWGAHHVDISHWAMGQENGGPVSVVGAAKHPVPYKNGYATDGNKFNTANEFLIRNKFANGQELFIQHGPGNGILIEGTKGRIFVNRGKITGKLIEEIAADKTGAQADWLQDEIRKLFAGREPKGHMDNFLDAIEDRKQPISDVFTHHRALTTCHLGNLAIRLDRDIQWDPQTELAIGDDDLNENWLRREQREGYQFS